MSVTIKRLIASKPKIFIKFVINEKVNTVHNVQTNA